jgi:hypothetical protein
MIALKLFTSVRVVVGIVVKFGLDNWWHDRRTTKNDFWSKVVLAITLLGATTAAITDLVQSYAASRAARVQTTTLGTIADFTTGGLAPDIFVEIYAGPNHPTPPRLSLSPEFPGIAAVWIANKESFPVYEFNTFMTTMTSEGFYTVSSKAFNNPTNREASTLGIGKSYVVMVPIQVEQTKKGPSLNFDFLTSSRRGNTSQTARFQLISNRWEYARKAIDLETTNTIVKEHSPNFPCEPSGEPIWN